MQQIMGVMWVQQIARKTINHKGWLLISSQLQEEVVMYIQEDI
jgi:hypothetical protein